MTPKYRGATSIPAKMWKQLVNIAHLYPNPTQFYEKAVALGKEYDISEKELIAWGTIDAHHKPKAPPPISEPQKTSHHPRQLNYTEPPGQPAPVTEEDIVRGHRDPPPPMQQQILDQEKPEQTPHAGWDAIAAKEKADAQQKGERTPETEGASPPNPVPENKKQR